MIDIIFAGLVTTFATTPTIGLDNAFQNSIMPIFYDFGRVLFKVSLAYGIYYIMRMKYTEGVNRMKWAVIGYACLKSITPFVALIDAVTGNIHF